jgi:hypothetical protein
MWTGGTALELRRRRFLLAEEVSTQLGFGAI